MAVMCLFTLTPLVYAKVGVGVGAGEIHINEPMHPGGIYSLPPLRIFNTGDVETVYVMNITYHQDRPELRPLRSWFTFSPDEFSLQSDQSEEVAVTMVIPIHAKPGKYFAFLESGPVMQPKNDGGTSVGVAVATKLFFEVEPSNILSAVV